MVFPAIFWIVALSYILAGSLSTYPLEFVHKALPALLLAGWLARHNFRNKPMAIAALLFCALGDAFLALTFEHQFIAGLSAFLVGHVLFGIFFWNWRDWQGRKIVVLLLMMFTMICVAALLLPATGPMLVPVSLYMLVITGMAMCAVLAAKKGILLILGAVVFMLSDTLIGVNKFFTPIPMEHLAIMFSYYLALFLLSLGIIKRTQLD